MIRVYARESVHKLLSRIERWMESKEKGVRTLIEKILTRGQEGLEEGGEWLGKRKKRER